MDDLRNTMDPTNPTNPTNPADSADPTNPADSAAPPTPPNPRTTEPARTGDEWASLTSFLQYQRETLAWKCAGLSAEQLREGAIPPSSLSLLGLVRHMAEVERSWFRVVLAGEQAPPFWARPEPGVYMEFEVEAADPEEGFRIWREECARSRATVAAAGSLDTVIEWRDQVFTLRYILTHMIEEYARHNGHADLLRERLDGSTGE